MRAPPGLNHMDLCACKPPSSSSSAGLAALIDAAASLPGLRTFGFELVWAEEWHDGVGDASLWELKSAAAERGLKVVNTSGTTTWVLVAEWSIED